MESRTSSARRTRIRDYKFDPEIIRQRRDELQAAVGDRLKLATGCDFHLSFENLQDLEKNPQKYTINQKTYLLVEFADFSIPPSMDDTMHQLAAHRIVAHHHASRAERDAAHASPSGCIAGCTRAATCRSPRNPSSGVSERPRKQRAEQWLDEDRVHFIASDAHNLKGRPLQLRAAFDAVAERRGEAGRAGPVPRQSPRRMGRPQPALRARASGPKR